MVGMCHIHSLKILPIQCEVKDISFFNFYLYTYKNAKYYLGKNKQATSSGYFFGYIYILILLTLYNKFPLLSISA